MSYRSYISPWMCVLVALSGHNYEGWGQSSPFRLSVNPDRHLVKHPVPNASQHEAVLLCFTEHRHCEEQQQKTSTTVLPCCLKKNWPDYSKYSVLQFSLYLICVFTSRNPCCPNNLQLISDEILLQCHRKPFIAQKHSLLGVHIRITRSDLLDLHKS